MIRTLGMLLLTLGVIVAASAGIRLGETEYSATVADGRVALADAPGDIDAVPVPAATRLDDWIDEAGAQFLAGLLLLTLGAVLGRVAISREGDAETTADGRDFGATLASLQETITRIRDLQDEETPEEIRARIEAALETLVLPMIDARGVLQHHYGLGGSALVLGPLSGAERQLNRAWSALVDEHTPEGQQSLAAAIGQVELARQAFEELHQHPA